MGYDIFNDRVANYQNWQQFKKFVLSIILNGVLLILKVLLFCTLVNCKNTRIHYLFLLLMQ